MLGRAPVLIVSLACAMGFPSSVAAPRGANLLAPAWRGETPTAPPGRRSRAAGGVGPARPGTDFGGVILGSLQSRTASHGGSLCPRVRAPTRDRRTDSLPGPSSAQASGR